MRSKTSKNNMRQIYKANKAVTTLSCGWITMTEELSESIQLLLRGREYPTQTRTVIEECRSGSKRSLQEDVAVESSVDVD